MIDDYETIAWNDNWRDDMTEEEVKEFLDGYAERMKREGL